MSKKDKRIKKKFNGLTGRWKATKLMFASNTLGASAVTIVMLPSLLIDPTGTLLLLGTSSAALAVGTGGMAAIFDEKMDNTPKEITTLAGQKIYGPTWACDQIEAIQKETIKGHDLLEKVSDKERREILKRLRGYHKYAQKLLKKVEILDGGEFNAGTNRIVFSERSMPTYKPRNFKK